MLDVTKLVKNTSAPAEITIEGIKFTGNQMAAGFVPNKIEISADALKAIIVRRLQEMGVTGVRIDVSLDAKPVGDQYEPEYVGDGATVTLTKMDGPGGGRM